jgi:hypothetical protein
VLSICHSDCSISMLFRYRLVHQTALEARVRFCSKNPRTWRLVKSNPRRHIARHSVVGIVGHYGRDYAFAHHGRGVGNTAIIGCPRTTHMNEPAKNPCTSSSSCYISAITVMVTEFFSGVVVSKSCLLSIVPRGKDRVNPPT